MSICKEDDIRRVAITGAAGRLSYQLLFRIAQGELYGPQQRVALHLLELPESLPRLKGIAMELQDSVFPLLHEVKIGSDPELVFQGVQVAFLVGSSPRKEGMERRELLRMNGKIFVIQGKALEKVAADGAVVLVVGNPCNTNCLIAERQSKRHHFFAMTLLDQNRATALLARKASVGVLSVKNVIIWGNHSPTQVPDYFNATIDGKPVIETIHDINWLETEFVPQVQQRGTAVIKALGQSSAASAAHAALEAMKALLYPTLKGSWFSMGINSIGNQYGLEEGVIFSFPCRSRGDGKVEIVETLLWNEPCKKRIGLTLEELLKERSEVDLWLK